jgi:Icc-related predicted phosphoesterase
MKIFAISDIHGVLKPIELASRYIEQADLVTISGDISKHGTREDALWVINAIEKLNKNILAVHGNWDKNEVSELLEEKGYSLHADGKVVDGVGFFGVGGSSKTPMNTRTEYSEEQIDSFIHTGFNKIKDAKTAILISHAPPYGTRDRSFIGLRGGSRRIAQFLRDHPIALSIVGHIHEADGVEMLDRTIVANPGSFKAGKFLLIDIGTEIHIERGRV